MPELRIFASPAELATQLATDTASTLARRLSETGRASLVVSGGTTPHDFFARLSREQIDWAGVTLTLADERWVDSREPASNEHLVRAALLRNHAAAARFIPLKNQAGTAKEGEKKCCRNLAGIPRPYTQVVLGMGSDGHTASLFPGSPELAEALDPNSNRICMAITPPSAPHARMSLTLAALLDAERIILHITGQEKRDTLEQALAGGSCEEMPIRAVLDQERCPVQVYWAP